MEKEGRLTQAAPLAIKLGESKKAMDAILQAKLIGWRKIPGWDKEPEDSRVHWEQDGTLFINFRGTQIDDLATLHGLPISRLWLNETLVSNLLPLLGMRLTEISLRGVKNLRDLSPLKGMPLERFHAEYLPEPTDLTPLSGMKLKEFLISQGHFTNLSVIRGMPLSHVEIADTITSLDDLADAPITELSRIGCHELRDISAVRKMPLKLVNLNDATKLRDFTPLLDCQNLENITVPDGRKEIEVLRQHPSLKIIKDSQRSNEPVILATDFWADYDAQNDPQMRERIAQIRAIIPDCWTLVTVAWGLKLKLYQTPIRDLSSLRPLPISFLSLLRTKVTDLAPLRGMRLKALTFEESAVTDVSRCSICRSWKRRWFPSERPTSKSCATTRRSNTSAGRATGMRTKTAPNSPPPNSGNAMTR